MGIKDPDVQAIYGGHDAMAAIEAQASEHDTKAFGFSAEQGPENTGDIGVDSFTEAAIVYQMAREILAPMYPCIARIYTDEQIGKLSAVTAPLLEKYGLNSGGVLAKFAPEIAFCVVVTPLAMQTVSAIREEKAQQMKVVNNEESHATE